MTKYRCTKETCKAEDSDRSRTPPVVLTCWKCRAGRDCKSLADQMETREGMFQVDEQGNFPWER